MSAPAGTQRSFLARPALPQHENADGQRQHWETRSLSQAYGTHKIRVQSRLPHPPLRYHSISMDPHEAAEPPELKATVLIVSFNCLPALRRCLEALEAAEQRETFEIRTVDCGSTDGSGQVDDEFPDIAVLRLPRNFGRTKARNIGARSAKGKYLFLIEPDVIVEPATIARLAAYLDATLEAVAAAPLLVTAEGDPVSRCGPLPLPAALYDGWTTGAPWYAVNPQIQPHGNDPVDVECPDPGAVMARLHAVKGMNYFDERYGQFGSDLDFFTQAFKASKRISVLPAVRAQCRRGADLWTPSSTAAQTTLSADYAVGIAAYTSKHYGWAAGFRIRLRMIFRSLLHFQFGLLSQILNGQKIDGSQFTP